MYKNKLVLMHVCQRFTMDITNTIAIVISNETLIVSDAALLVDAGQLRGLPCARSFNEEFL